jgi:hypothetical protein
VRWRVERNLDHRGSVCSALGSSVRKRKQGALAIPVGWCVDLVAGSGERAGIDTMAGQWPCAGGLPAV